MSRSYRLFLMAFTGLMLLSWSGPTVVVGDEGPLSDPPVVAPAEAVATEKADVGEQTDAADETDVGEQTVAAGESVAAEETAVDDWQPRLAVTLYTTAEGIPITTTQKVKVPFYTMSFEDIERNGKAVKQAVRNVAWREREVTVAKPAGATMFCDALTVEVAAKNNQMVYAFECSERIQLRYDGMIIDCDSAKLHDGRFELVNAKISHNGTSLTSDKLTVVLPVRGLKTSEFGLPIPPASCDLLPPALHPNGPAVYPLPVYQFDEADSGFRTKPTPIQPQRDSAFALPPRVFEAFREPDDGFSPNTSAK